MTQIIFNQNDNLIEVLGLTDIVSGNFANSATVTATLVDGDDAEVVGQIWPITLVYVAASDGDYQAILNDVLVLTVGDLYTVKIDADAGVDMKAHWEFPVRAETRTGA